MIKARIAPRFGAPAMLHTFAPRLAAAALAALRCSVLMCGRSEYVRKTGYASISVFAPACSLFIHTFYDPAWGNRLLPGSMDILFFSFCGIYDYYG
jgi:hypothetical protein